MRRTGLLIISICIYISHENTYGLPSAQLARRLFTPIAVLSSAATVSLAYTPATICRYMRANKTTSSIAMASSLIMAYPPTRNFVRRNTPYLIRKNLVRGHITYQIMRNFARRRVANLCLWAGSIFQSKKLIRLASYIGTIETQRRIQQILSLASSANQINLFTMAGAHVGAHEQSSTMALHDAISNRLTDTVEALIAAGVDVNNLNHNQETPLHAAVATGHADIIHALIQAGADVTIRNSNGKTPLQIALDCGHHAVACTISNALNNALFKAISDNAIEKITALISAGADINASDENGQRALHLATEISAYDTELILASLSTSSSDGNGYFPLKRKDPAIALYLIEAGADIKAQDEQGNTPLHNAAESGVPNIVNALIQAGADVDAPNIDKQTPLHKAAMRGNAATVTLLIKAGAHISALNKSAETPLHAAAACGNIDTIDILIKAGSNINAPRSNGDTPLHTAAYHGRLDVVKKLVSAGAQTDIKEHYGRTAIALAGAYSQPAIVTYLESNRYNTPVVPQ